MTKTDVGESIWSLSHSGYGCSVCKTFFGCIMYMYIMSPSLCGLQFVLDVCYTYAVCNDLMFSAKKTIYALLIDVRSL